MSTQAGSQSKKCEMENTDGGSSKATVSGRSSGKTGAKVGHRLDLVRPRALARPELTILHTCNVL